jgi:iron complex transport system substrate-binding protein
LKLLLLLLLLWSVACKEQSPATTSQRVVSLSPNTTEAMFAIGAGDRLVGRSSHCDFPPEAQKLPSVGDYANPNIEAILALEPHLVIGEQGPAGPALADQLRGHEIETFFPPSDSIADVTALLRDLGRRFGVADKADKVATEMNARVARIAAWAKTKKTRSVVVVFDVSPIFVAGPGSFPDELVRLAGGKNLVDRGGKWPTLDVERVLTLDPDVLVDGVVMQGKTTQRSRLLDVAGFSELRAVKEGRVRRLRNDAPLRPGPRIGDGLREMARAIHGEEPPE